jgi:glycosyltransferase involved in cell wall biosynthesis
MKVSIVIPVYNGANYLREAIDSALAQTYSDLEVLVINDGSRDDGATERIALSYGDRIRYIAKPNGGVSTALNLGIREMRGDWFCWLSHDDRYLPAKTSAQVAFARQHPEARVIGCNFELIDEEGRVYDTVREKLEVVRTGRELLDGWTYGCALMIHRDVFARTGPFDEANRTTQDLDMWLRMIEHAPLWWMPDVLCQRREHPSMGSQTEVRYTRDKDELFLRLVSRYGAASWRAGRKTPRARAEVWFWLSNNAVNRGALRGARAALKRAWREWPSPRNPALGRLVLGIRAAMKLRHWAARVGARVRPHA